MTKYYHVGARMPLSTEDKYILNSFEQFDLVHKEGDVFVHKNGYSIELSSKKKTDKGTMSKQFRTKFGDEIICFATEEDAKKAKLELAKKNRFGWFMSSPTIESDWINNSFYHTSVFKKCITGRICGLDYLTSRHNAQQTVRIVSSSLDQVFELGDKVTIFKDEFCDTNKIRRSEKQSSDGYFDHPHAYRRNLLKKYHKDVCDIIFQETSTIVMLRNGKSALAKLKPGDKFDFEKGFLYAFNKALRKKQ